MAILPITEDNIDTFTLETNPKRYYSSSSVGGITGSIDLFARRSTIEKEVFPSSLFKQSLFNDQNIDEFRRDILRLNTSDITDSVITYMSAVNAQQESVKKNQKINIFRFTPPPTFNANTLRKSAVINTLMPYWRTAYPSAHYAYHNYHCLNFFTSSNTPSETAILYPNPVREDSSTLTEYGFNNAFTFDFWIKPKYTTDGRDSQAVYRPGTIFHLTSSYCVTLHSGSSRDINGRINAFRLGLQLTSSADIAPDQINFTSLPDYVFISNDNLLPINEWSHVTVKWGGPNYNFGTGSFFINGQQSSNFTITSSMLVGDQAYGDPSVLSIGNYYQGTNTGTSALSFFFTNETAIREGLYELQSGNGFEPLNYSFSYPLNAEVQELKIYDRYLLPSEIQTLNSSSVAPGAKDLRFFLPPMFTEESPERTFYLGSGGYPVTPFFSKNGSTNKPFAKEMSFGCGGHYINLENYVRDFATGRYGRLLNLTASIYEVPSTTPLSANTLLYGTGSNIKRLYTVLPSDNGKMLPNYNWLSGLNSEVGKNDLGFTDKGFISLRNVITGNLPSFTMVQESGSIVDAMMGGNNPSTVGAIPGNSLAVYHRTRDNSSNQVVFFDISNLFYGNRIKPGSFVIKDTDLSSSNGKVSITIKDDGYGNLYRADSVEPHATWASLGNIFYDEGIVLIKNPQLYFFGENQYEIEFDGIQNIHVMSIDAFARPMQLISSSNPSYYNTGSVDNFIGDNASNTDEKYVIISSVNIHDENLNVIARTNVAQPVLKRSSDKMKFVIKLDF